MSIAQNSRDLTSLSLAKPHPTQGLLKYERKTLKKKYIGVNFVND